MVPQLLAFIFWLMSPSLPMLLRITLTALCFRITLSEMLILSRVREPQDCVLYSRLRPNNPGIGMYSFLCTWKYLPKIRIFFVVTLSVKTLLSFSSFETPSSLVFTQSFLETWWDFSSVLNLSSADLLPPVNPCKIRAPKPFTLGTTLVPCVADKFVEMTTVCVVSSWTSVMRFSDWLSLSLVSPFLRLLALCLRPSINCAESQPQFFLPLPPLVLLLSVLVLSFEGPCAVLASCVVKIVLTRELVPLAPAPVPGSWESLLSSWESRRPAIKDLL